MQPGYGLERALSALRENLDESWRRRVCHVLCERGRRNCVLQGIRVLWRVLIAAELILE